MARRHCCSHWYALVFPFWPSNTLSSFNKNPLFILNAFIHPYVPYIKADKYPHKICNPKFWQSKFSVNYDAIVTVCQRHVGHDGHERATPRHGILAVIRGNRSAQTDHTDQMDLSVEKAGEAGARALAARLRLVALPPPLMSDSIPSKRCNVDVVNITCFSIYAVKYDGERKGKQE